MATILYRKCESCTMGCEACRMTGYMASGWTVEQVASVLSTVPIFEQLKEDLAIARSHCDAYARENARLHSIINGGRHDSQVP